MPTTFDSSYLLTLTGQLNIFEILCLTAALICIELTSYLHCEFIDSLKTIYPNLSTLLIRSIYQSFIIFCLTITLTIFLIHICYVNPLSGRCHLYMNRLCLAFNMMMGSMMIFIGICTAFWSDKIRRIPPELIRYEYKENEWIQARPAAVIVASILANLSGLLLLIEACARPRLIAKHDRRRIPIENIRLSFI